jgi:hypothetical protein
MGHDDFLARFRKIYDHLKLPDESQEATYQRMAEVLRSELDPRRGWTAQYMRQLDNQSGAGKELSRYIITAVNRYYDRTWGKRKPQGIPWHIRRLRLEKKAQLDILDQLMDEWLPVDTLELSDRLTGIRDKVEKELKGSYG